MKNVDVFIRKDWAWPDTLNGQMTYYKELNAKIEYYLSRKKAYDDLLSREETSEESNQLSFKEQWELYRIIDNLIKRNSGKSTYLDIDLQDLKQRLKKVYENVHVYERIKYELSDLIEGKHRILCQNITFDNFYDDCFNERCVNGHFFVRFEDELKCMCCGATTKDYSLSKEQLDFLTLCAKSQGVLLEEVTKEDLPLLQVLMEKQDYYRNSRKPLDSFDDEDDDYFAKAEERWLEDEQEILNLRRQIKKAHLLDSKTYDSEDIKVSNPKYLSDDKAKELLLEVEKELEEVKRSDSRFKELMIEECNTARFEILILSGAHIPTLLEQAKDEVDKVALVKAYYNISNYDFRVNSDYFASENRNLDAISYNCVTANPEINNRILQMKLRRK